jgi:hypothetical protein
MHSIDPLDAPSRRWLHVTSGRVGAHGRNQGRSYLDLQRTLFEHGFLLERELPTGRDDFDELETYSDDQIKLASKRRSFGAIWLDDIDSRLNAGLDLAHGIIPSYPIAVQIAVKLYSNWARFFKAGVIGRHNSTDTMLGGHAMMLLGFIAFREKTWAILANSWGPDFGMYSPKDLVGCALVSTDYLKEILYHGAVVFFQHRDEFERTHRILTNGVGATDQVESKFPLTRAAMITLFSPLAVAGKSWWTKTMRSMGDESRSRLVR